jgi:hypothetical protein
MFGSRYLPILCQLLWFYGMDGTGCDDICFNWVSNTVTQAPVLSASAGGGNVH